MLNILLRILIVMCFMFCLSSCAKSGKVYDGFLRGMYEGANQTQEMQRKDLIPPPGKEPPTYDQYEKERQEMLKTDEDYNRLQ